MGLIETAAALISAGAFIGAIAAYLAFTDLQYAGLRRVKTALDRVAEEAAPNKPWRSAIHGDDAERRRAFLERYKARLTVAIASVNAERSAAQGALILKALGLIVIIAVSAVLALIGALIAATGVAGAERAAVSLSGVMEAIAAHALTAWRITALGAGGEIYEHYANAAAPALSGPIITAYSLLIRALLGGAAPAFLLFAPKAMIAIHLYTNHIITEMRELAELRPEEIGERLIKQGYWGERRLRPRHAATERYATFIS